MSIHIHKKHKYCFLCKKKIATWRNWFEWGYYDYDIGNKETVEGIEYYYIDKYWHKKCAWNNRPVPHYEDESE